MREKKDNKKCLKSRHSQWHSSIKRFGSWISLNFGQISGKKSRFLCSVSSSTRLVKWKKWPDFLRIFAWTNWINWSKSHIHAHAQQHSSVMNRSIDQQLQLMKWKSLAITAHERNWIEKRRSNFPNSKISFPIIMIIQWNAQKSFIAITALFKKRFRNSVRACAYVWAHRLLLSFYF